MTIPIADYQIVDTCPVCGSGAFTTASHSTGGAYLVDRVVEIPLVYANCNRCGMLWQLYTWNDTRWWQYYASGDYRRALTQGTGEISPQTLEAQSKRANQLLQSLDGLDKIDSWVDVGCSAGFLLYSLREAHAMDVYGVEIDPLYKDMAIERHDLEIRPQADRTADVLSAVHVLEHVLDPIATLGEWAGVCDKLIVEVPHRDNMFSALYHHPLIFDTNTLRRAADTALLTVAAIDVIDDVVNPSEKNIRMVCTT